MLTEIKNFVRFVKIVYKISIRFPRVMSWKKSKRKIMSAIYDMVYETNKTDQQILSNVTCRICMTLKKMKAN